MDLSSDLMHCGWCGHACDAPYEHTVASCVGSTCGWECEDGWVDNDASPGCETSCPGATAEVCNGVDDDCDGTPDEGFACVLGELLTCATICSTYGTGSCSLTCELPAPEDCSPPAEACNGIDDDCDTLVDEDFPPGSCGSCTPDCTGLDCGPDPLCGTSCGTCTSPETCNAAGQCVCIADCGTRVCGPDPVCGLSCGTCTPPETCDAWGACVCIPDCTGRVCGPDPVCGLSCGTCTPPATCDAAGQCVSACVPDCSGRDCGPDPVCGTSCGTCTAPETCNSSGLCECVPDCSGRVCGPDPVCSTSCGTCTAPETCDSSGNCVTTSTIPSNACTAGSQNRRDCSNARIISRTTAAVGYVISDDTCSGGDYHEGDCTVFDVGNDHTYAIYLVAGERLDMILESHSTDCSSGEDWHSRLKLLYNPSDSTSGSTSCPTFLECWIGPASYDSWDLVRSYSISTDGWYFIVVDGGASGWDEHRGHYTLDVSISGCTPSDCSC